MNETQPRRAPLRRLLQILFALQSDRRPNARQLAEECEVSRRTIFRDLETIEAAGLPVEYDATRQGYRLAVASPVGRTMPEEHEVLALVALANAGADCDAFGLTGPARAGLAKLIAGLPEGPRRRAEALDLATRPESPAPPREETRRLVHDRLLQAFVRRVDVRLVVREAGRRAEETRLSPYRMFPTREGWSVIGRSSLHRRVRLFAVAEVESVELTDDPAAVPPRFRTDRWLGRTWSGEPGPGRSEVHIRFAAEAASAIRDGRWHASQRIEAMPDGRVDLRLTVDRPEDMAGWVLGHGEHAEVLAPAHDLGRPSAALATHGSPAGHTPARVARCWPRPISGGWVVDAPRSATRIRLVPEDDSRAHSSVG